jgi:hypothetical protein
MLLWMMRNTMAKQFKSSPRATLEIPTMRQTRARDVTKPSALMSIPISASIESATLPKSPTRIDLPTAVTSPPSWNQPNASFPSGMSQRNPNASSQPAVPAGVAMSSASQTAPPSKPPATGMASRGGKTYADNLPRTITHAEIKAASKRYGGW